LNHYGAPIGPENYLAGSRSCDFSVSEIGKSTRPKPKKALQNSVSGPGRIPSGADRQETGSL